MSKGQPCLIVSTRNVYGVNKIYPECNMSKKFCDALGFKTFTPELIKAVLALGFVLLQERKQVVLTNDLTDSQTIEIKGERMVCENNLLFKKD